jgi:ribosomal protein S18 acetylase RimI-like enzyme
MALDMTSHFIFNFMRKIMTNKLGKAAVIKLQEISIPTPEGMTCRAATQKDFPNMAKVANLEAQLTTGSDDTNESEFLVDWENPEFEPKTDSQVVLDEKGEMLGYAIVYTDQKPPNRPYVWMRLRPDNHDHAAGDYMLGWAEARSRQTLDLVPSEVRVTMSMHTVSGFEPLLNLFDRHGLSYARRSFQMRIQLEAKVQNPILPEGMEIVDFEVERDFEAFFRATDEGFQDHFGHVDEDFETAYPRWKHYVENDEGYDPGLFFFVKKGEDIVASARCRKMSWEDENMGWISELSVLRPWRRLGIGKALLQHCFQVFEERGKSAVGLGVDAESLTGATKLYEQAGMKVFRSYDRYEKILRDGIEIIKTDLEEQA